MKFTASRLSEGNKMFPAEIHCEPNGLTVKVPGLFSGQSKHLPYNQIGEVSVDAPLVGYSTIHFYTAGTRVSANGFTSSEVKQIKAAIEKGQSGRKVSRSDDDDSSNNEVELLEAQLDHQKEMLEEKQKHELRLENIRSASEAIEKINELDLGGENPTPETISRQLEFCITLASSALSETFDIADTNADIYESEKDKYNQSEKVVNAAIKKSELGLNKLRLCEPKDKALNYMTVYREQINPLKVKQIHRKWEVKIQQEKPAGYLWGFGFVFPPIFLYQIYKVVNANVLLPKKRDAEIAQIK